MKFKILQCKSLGVAFKRLLLASAAYSIYYFSIIRRLTSSCSNFATRPFWWTFLAAFLSSIIHNNSLSYTAWNLYVENRQINLLLSTYMPISSLYKDIKILFLLHFVKWTRRNIFMLRYILWGYLWGYQSSNCFWK